MASNTFDLYGDIWIGLSQESYKQLWCLNVIQDVFAIQKKVPLRIISKKKAENTIQSIGAKYPNLIDFSILPDITSAMKILESNEHLEDELCAQGKSFWLTSKSFDHPLFSTLVSWKRWAALDNWFSLCVYNLLSEKNKGELQILEYFRSWIKIGYQEIGLGSGTEAIMVAGPCTNLSHNKFLTINQEKLNEWTSDLKQFINDAPHWIKETLWLRISSRPITTTSELEESLYKISRAVERVSRIEWRGEQLPPILGKGTCALIGRFALAYEDQVFNSLKKQDVSHQLCSSEINMKDMEVDYIIPQSEAFNNISPEFCDRWYGSLRFRVINDGSWTLYPCAIVERERQAEKKANWIITAENSEKELETLRYEFFYGRLLLLRDHLQREFGIVTSVSLKKETTIEKLKKKSVSANQKMKDLSEFIAGYCSQFLHADLVNINTLNYGKNRLENQALLIDGYSQDLKLKDKNISDTSKRYKYLCYRVVDSGDAKICFAYGEWKVSDPENEPFQVPYEIDETVHSLMSIPLKAYGRIFGVLNIGGFCPYNFSNSDFRFAAWIAESISYYISRSITLTKIEEMITKALDVGIDESDRYHNICDAFCDIFLSYGATFWKPDKVRPDNFLPIGWSNRPDLKSLTKDKSITAKSSEDDSSIGRAMKLLKSGEQFAQLKIEELIGDRSIESWVEGKPHRQWLIENKITWAVVIPITSRKGAFSHQNSSLPWLCLYYQDGSSKNKLLSKSWNTTVQFVKEQVALLLNSMHHESSKERQWQAIINHEVKQKVDSVNRVADKIVKWVLSKSPKKKKEILNLWNKDIINYTKEVHTLIKKLQDPKLMRDAIRSGFDPLHFLYKINLKEESAERINFRKKFTYNFNQGSHILAKKKVRYHIQNDWKVKHPIVHMQPTVLNNILRNLIDNAVKYSVPKSELFTGTIMNQFEFIFYMYNFSRSLGEIDPDSLFKAEVRGENIGKEHGEGIGLFLTRGYCELCGIDLKVKIEPLSYKVNNEERCTFRVELSFPKSMVLTT